MQNPYKNLFLDTIFLFVNRFSNFVWYILKQKDY